MDGRSCWLAYLNYVPRHKGVPSKMTSPTEQNMEIRRARRAQRLLAAAEGGLEFAIQKMGGDLQGITIRTRPEDILLTIRAVFDGKGMVAFAGGSTVADAYLKAYREAVQNALRWKVDKWYKGTG